MIIEIGKATIHQNNVQVFLDFSEPGASNIIGDIMAPKIEGIKIIKKIMLMIITVDFILVDLVIDDLNILTK